MIVCFNYSKALGISFTKSIHGRKCWAWWGQGLFNLISDDKEVFFWVTHKSSELASKISVATPKSPQPNGWTDKIRDVKTYKRASNARVIFFLHVTVDT